MDDEGVPPVPGPKTYPFKDGDEPLKIKWLRHIGKGIHAHVWAVLINGKLYVLKVFTFRKRYYVNPEWKVNVSKAEEIAYFDPFSCECRAYGRIREAGLEKYIAKCYGYIKLARDDFDPLMHDPKKWEDTFGYMERHKGRPFRALVKEFIKTYPDLYPTLPNHGPNNSRLANRFFRGAKDARTLVRGLRMIHKSGILICDINDGNVMNGRLIDFSRAWTVPHPVLNKETMENPEITMYLMEDGIQDADQVDYLIDWWNREHTPDLKIWDRCLPSHDYNLRSRSRPDRVRREGGRNASSWLIRPELYNWQARKRDNGTGQGRWVGIL
ncbi:hypothetical protein PG991_010878 [Apiospora marii]|uniref:Protein kinase domain-containing protein n=1 Tax=Apiospora marii TaxID=335849 RepID=A0ABR1RDP9_9PEZI